MDIHDDNNNKTNNKNNNKTTTRTTTRPKRQVSPWVTVSIFSVAFDGFFHLINLESIMHSCEEDNISIISFDKSYQAQVIDLFTHGLTT